MKKISFFIAALALFVSCAKTEVTFNDGGKVESSAELTISTIASPTKSIAEGTKVPIENAISFFPRFYSDISSADFSGYNKIGMFGYDSSLEVWRNAAPPQSIIVDPGHMGPVMSLSRAHGQTAVPLPIDYNFTPMYWPAGDRVFMDYVACSYSFYLLAMGSAQEQMAVEPVIDNDNRMSVRYEYNLLNTPLTREAHVNEESIISILAVLRNMEILGYAQDIDVESIVTEFDETFLGKYRQATQVILEECNPEDADLLSGETPEEKEADAADVVNRGYWLYMNYYPLVSKFMQDDLLYAHGRSIKNDNHGSVKATFNHAKAWIKVIVNNQTSNDLYVENIKFNGVSSNGTLIIDNSKSEFEAYWDFTQEQEAVDINFTPYNNVNLDGPASPANVNALTGTKSAMQRVTLIPGLVPDQYIVPSGCYGPALSISKYPAAGQIQALQFNYLNGGKSFNLAEDDCKTIVNRLGGMMFPAQEPGKITIKYIFWPHINTGFTSDESHNTQIFPMANALKILPRLEDENIGEISLNLPRQTWQMGKVYVYVLTIAEDEITINPIVTEWEYADPIIGPDQTGMRTDTEATEVFNDGGDISNAFGN